MLTVDPLSYFFFKQKTAYEMRISDWSSDVCSSDLLVATVGQINGRGGLRSPRYPRQNDVCFFPILPIHPVIMRNGKLDGVNAGEISFVHNVFAPRAIARFLSQNIGHGVGNGIKCRDHRQSQYPAAVLQFSQQRRSEEHTSELQSLMRISYAVFC